MKKEKNYNILKNILMIFILTTMMLITTIFTNNSVKATINREWSGDENGGIFNFGSPKNLGNSAFGLVPAKIGGERSVSFFGNASKINGKMIFCMNYHTSVRSGKRLTERLYILSDNAVSFNEVKNVVEDNAINYILSTYPSSISIPGGSEFVSHNATIDTTTMNENGNIDTSREMILREREPDENHIREKIKEKIEALISELSEGAFPNAYETSIDDISAGEYNESKNKGHWDGGIYYGPIVTVMETDGEYGYKASSQEIYNNDNKPQAAYILSASENMYGQNPGTKYSEQEIQHAYWMFIDPDDYRAPENITENGKLLYEMGQRYANFVEYRKNNGYNVSIDNSEARTIVNRKDKKYIVGPFSISYPEYGDISYIKSMSITTKDGVILNISENSSDFSLILERGGISGSNGISNTFPGNGENFFIEFSAERAKYPKDITLSVECEYVSSCEVSGNKMERTLATNYQYMGYINMADYYMERGTYTKEWRTWTLICGKEEHSHHGGCYDDKTGKLTCYDEEHDHDIRCWGWVYDSKTMEANASAQRNIVYQPYIQCEERGSVAGQPLYALYDAKRQYATAGASVDIDLSMELGGYVWSDNTGGKESLGNNIKDNEDIPMPNVLVTLFRADGTQIGTTKTDKDGRYIFKNLNAMYQYYVRFTYNGQYYQPVVYRAPNVTDKNAEQYKYGWYGDSWSVSSNGADVKTQRTEYNAKFASIGSSPANYYGAAGWNETFTKEQLLGMTLQTDGTYKKTREAVIDEFGNLILENSQDATTRKMIQYVKDCQMNSYTGNGDGTVDLYPVPSLFIIDNVRNIKPETSRLILSMLKINVNDRCLYDNAYYINQGLVEREKADLTIKKDVEKVTVEINGQTHEYGYDTRENASNSDGTWEIGIRLSDAYYTTKYSRELYKSDYLYKVSLYGEDPEAYGKDTSDELEVYVTYKIMVRNQSQSIRCRVDELVDYYDSDYDFVKDRSYITFRTGDRKGNMYSVKDSNTSRYTQPGTTTKIEGYDSLYIQGLGQNAQAIDAQGNNVGNEIADGIYLNSGETAYIYLTYKVKKDNMNNEDWVRLDETIETAQAVGVGKENIVEINGYSTLYKEGTMIPNVGYADANTKAGLVDKDSNPGNLNPNDVPKDGTIRYENFEDDTDKAPNIRLVLFREGDDADRVISGVVWEDERTKEVKNATIGNGLREENEKLIDGVTVQLVELMDNGMEFIWREFGSDLTGISSLGKGTGSGTKSSETPIINAFNLVSNYEFGNNQKGAYAFKSFVPGKYVVRFIYGDTIKTILTTNDGGLNDTSYNGQDYKSTTYQTGVTQNKTYTWRKPSTWINGQETLGEILAQVSTFKSDASNNETANVSNGGENGYLYDITSSEQKLNVSDTKDIESRRNQVVDYSDNNVRNNIAEILASFSNDPKNESKLKELMEKTNMIAETGMMVIELEKDTTNTSGQTENNKSSYKVTGVDLGLEQRPQAQLVVDKKVTNVKLTLADGSILFDSKGATNNLLWHGKSSYTADYKKNILQQIRKEKANNPYGLIQMSMDEEIMHGATIKISYDIMVTNLGEVDYKENKFYYTGEVANANNIVKTSADKVIDYVANNLQFYKADNNDWEIISNKDVIDGGLVNKTLEDKVNLYNAIIVTEKLSEKLVPEISKAGTSNVTIPLVLTQLITSENTTDDLTYRNIVEIAETSNTAGRRMAFSIVGNQDPTQDPAEVDTDRAEVVRILPPFGNAGLPYVIAGIIAMIVIIIMSGVIFIKKKVLTK